MQRRPRTGCWICWKRKLKCDSFAPVHCTNCIKRGVECQYDKPDQDSQFDDGRAVPSRDVTEAGLQRDRARRACLNCANHKIKCSADQSGCHRCLQNDLVCQYPDSKRRSNERGCSPASSRSTRRLGRKSRLIGQTVASRSQDRSAPETSCRSAKMQREQDLTGVHQRQWNSEKTSCEFSLSKDIMKHCVEAYFEYIYPITTHGFLHQGSLQESLDKDTTPAILWKIIVICASPFVNSTVEAEKQTAVWKDEVDLYIMRHMRSFTNLNLQVILLWTNYHHYIGDLGKTWMLLGLSARLAYCLQIQVEPSAIASPTEIECRRRMMWNIRIMDRLLAGTVEEFSLTSDFVSTLRLPCDDYFYLAEISVETESLGSFGRDGQIANIGGFAALATLIDIWRDILLFMRDLRQEQAAEPIMHHTSSLHKRLSDFENRLPRNLRFTDRNLYLQPTTAQKITFIMLWSWWNECHYDLFRFILPGFRESVDATVLDQTFVCYCRKEVVRWAVSQSITWRLFKSSMAHVPVSDPLIAILVHSNAKVLLACRTLVNLSELLEDSNINSISELSSLLDSNVSLLDDLAARIPRVAIIKMEIQKVILQNGLKLSAEESLNKGLPLKRRHSCDNLMALNGNGTETSERAVEEISSNTGTGDSPLSGVGNWAMRDASLAIAKNSSHLTEQSPFAAFDLQLETVPDFYMHTPLNLSATASCGSQNFDAEQRAGQTGSSNGRQLQAGSYEFFQLQSEQQQDLIQAAPFLGLYDADYFGGWLSHCAPDAPMQ